MGGSQLRTVDPKDVAGWSIVAWKLPNDYMV
jgi:hypothetical protein